MSHPAPGGRPSPRSVVVIGAGPYGLSAAAHLRAAGLEVRAFGDPMHSWRDTMPAGMFLKSTPDASTISAPRPGHRLEDHCRSLGETPPSGHDRVSVELFIRYGQWFQRELVPFLETDRVLGIRQSPAWPGSFELELDSGERLATAAVVVASGLTGFAHVPPMLAALAPEGLSAEGPVSHSSHHPDMAALAKRSVLVVGAGQSALENAALLHEAGGQVELVARGRVRFGGPPTEGPRWQPESPMGPAWSLWAMSRYPQAFRSLPQNLRLRLVKEVLGPSGAWWLRPRAEGVFPVHSGSPLRAARREGDKVVVSTGAPDGPARELTVDHVLAATGYRVDLGALPFLAPELRARITDTGGFPELDAGMASRSVPGLWFTGLPAAASFGPFMRFVCGTEFASARIAAAVAARA